MKNLFRYTIALTSLIALKSHAYNDCFIADRPKAKMVVQPTVVHVFDAVDFNGSESRPGIALDSNFQPRTMSMYDYQWQFGDGSKTHRISGSHRWAKPGTYSLILTVKNECNRFDTAQATIVVKPPQPRVAFALSASILQTGKTLSLFPTAGALATKMTIDWNDGSEPVVLTGQYNFSTGTLTHTYPVAGSYSPTITVLNSSGSLTKAFPITITDTTVPPNVIVANSDAINNIQNNKVMKLALQVGAQDDGTIKGLTVDFGDGTSTNIDGAVLYNNKALKTNLSGIIYRIGKFSHVFKRALNFTPVITAVDDQYNTNSVAISFTPKNKLPKISTTLAKGMTISCTDATDPLKYSCEINLDPQQVFSEADLLANMNPKQYRVTDDGFIASTEVYAVDSDNMNLNCDLAGIDSNGNSTVAFTRICEIPKLNNKSLKACVQAIDNLGAVSRRCVRMKIK